MRRGVRLVGLLAVGVFLHACASGRLTTPPAQPTPGPPPVAAVPAPSPVLTFADLPGWGAENHLAALHAFQAGCGVAKDKDLHAACLRARSLDVSDDAGARGFLETNFTPRLIGANGILTAYFAPEYTARRFRSPPYTAPVRRRPADLVLLDLGPFDPSLAGRKISGRVVDGGFEPYADRAEIESEPARAPIAWMKPEELFFLQIQGSGVLTLPDGARLKLTYSASNGKPFVGIAKILRDQGALPDGDTSGDAIRTWLADHRGPEADAVMRQDPRYVFFNAAPDDGREPSGAAGAALIPGRALAIDPAKHALGAVFWIDASAPRLAGAFPIYQRLAIALDVGGAIKGSVRADLYTGSGAAAGVEAGRVRHELTLYELTPITSPAP